MTFTLYVLATIILALKDLMKRLENINEHSIIIVSVMGFTIFEVILYINW